jgi:DNA-binding MarR family transcriptional regulator
MTLDYVLIPIQILTLKGLTLREKILLSLVASFNKKGLRMSNDKLAEILNICPSRVSKILKNLKRKQCVKIEKPQSPWRVIYLLQNAKVDDILLHTKRQSKNILLCPLEPSTLAQRANITKRTKDTAAAHTKKPLCDIPPTKEQVKAYSFTRGFPNFDAKHFVEWYAANDWCHKDGEPVLNWKQTVLSWLRRDQAKEQQAQAAKPAPKRGDPDWLPDEQEAEAIMKNVGL